VTQPAESLFITQDDFAGRIGVSRNTVIAMIGRGELKAEHFGARVLIAWPAWQLKALGTDAGTMAKTLGIRNLSGLLAFLGEDGNGRQPSGGQGRSESAHT
jgi:hypothetical protein